MRSYISVDAADPTDLALFKLESCFRYFSAFLIFLTQVMGSL